MVNSNEYMRIYMLKRYHERKAEAFNFLENTCEYCGSQDDLEIDHIDWREKSFSISKMWSVSIIRFYEELKKCQLLCAVCHLEKTRFDMREIKKQNGGANQYGRY